MKRENIAVIFKFFVSSCYKTHEMILLSLSISSINKDKKLKDFVN